MCRKKRNLNGEPEKYYCVSKSPITELKTILYVIEMPTFKHMNKS